jgi:5-methylcytosine-specific restriction protein A
MPNLPDKKQRPWIPRRKRKTQLFKSNASRSSAEMKAFYDSKAWRSLRNYKRQLDPLCEECERKGIIEPGMEVDHIKSLRDNGAPLSLGNLQNLCKSCHASKSAKEGQRRRYIKKYY